MDIGQAATASIVKEIGLGALPLEQQRETLEQIGATIFQGVVARAMEQLGEADRAALGELFAAEATTGDDVLAFLNSRVPNLDALVAEEAGKFKGAALDFMAAVTKPE